MIYESFLCAVGLASVHLLAGYIRFLNRTPRSLWLSLASGIAVAFVFVHIFPSLAAWQSAIERSGGTATGGFLQFHAYLVALAGMLAVHGIQRFAESARRQNQNDVSENDQSNDDKRANENNGTPKAADSGAVIAFRLHILTFAAFNILISYLLVHRQQPGVRGLLLYFTAMAVYLLVTDYRLRKNYGADYDRKGRWILALAVFVGWTTGVATEINAGTLAASFAFLAGGTIVGVIKEETAAESAHSFWALLVGAAFYVALLLAQ